MRDSYLEVTYRKGRPLAAYYYLPRAQGDAVARSELEGAGLVVDFAKDGRAIGIEITAPAQFDLAGLNRLLRRLGHPPVPPQEMAPLVAA